MKSVLWIFIFTLLQGTSSGFECYNCFYSINDGCDFEIDNSKVSETSTVSCATACYTIVSKSTDEVAHEVQRGCSVSPVCADTSYSVDKSTYIKSCCTEDRCNNNVGNEIFQCYECSDVDGAESTCPKEGYKDSDFAVFDTSFCTSFCEKKVRTENGISTITRSCQDDCEDSSNSGFGISTETFCCEGDICNLAANLSLSYTEMAALAFCGLVVVMAFSCQI